VTDNINALPYSYTSHLVILCMPGTMAARNDQSCHPTANSALLSVEGSI